MPSVPSATKKWKPPTAAWMLCGRSEEHTILETWGVQLYTVRTVLPKKPRETLDAIRAIGYKEVEATYGGLDALWPALQASGLKPVRIRSEERRVGAEG